MKKTVLKTFALATLFFASAANAQVGVGVPAGDIHPSAELEVKSSTKGFLPPRMTKAQRIAMIAQGSTTFPAAGLLVFQTDGDANEPTGLYFFDGTAWRNGAGVVGAKGDKGDRGETGAQGLQGQAGAQGPKGDTGLKGDVGPKGEQGGVTTAGSGSAIPFGIKTGKIYLNPDAGYYSSIAVRPVNSNSLGSYSLVVDYYDINDNVIVVYQDNLTNNKTTNSLDSSGAANTVITTAARTQTTSVTHTERWAYIGNSFPVSSITGAAYAIVQITFRPATYVAGQAFDIDRVVFRE
jgi:hypothetical protein